ncbi:uncharacterized protein LOC107273615 isoform X2 [Cephus cinctus]|uniref:Uncharacterized protein LOC107273615 isoform X2 n=1 Tax=Cephus cinctus TaxID=211228 RepID=A0AAJ7FTI5_CEPCN|nr:uncharacterized protein LOC107273615 isoform X2 [Cephus cinctus]
MNSFIKTVKSVTSRRDVLVRESLQKLLNTSVMEMQSAPGVMEGGTVGNCEEAMTLCSALEAMFLHGLKDSLLNRVTEALSGPDFDAMPQPSFWGPLLVFSHRQIIDQIQGLTQITTEVGYCRAWIRLALNEGLLSSYLSSIRRDNTALKPYYNRSAFIRDTDLVDVAQRLIESLDHVQFELACNTSLLNFWSSTPLLMAAIWSPPMKSCPVSCAVDIAKTITSELTDSDNIEEIETASSIGSMGSFNSSQSALNSITNLTEDDPLKNILAKRKTNGTDVRNSNRSSPVVMNKRKIKENTHKREETTTEPTGDNTTKRDAETSIDVDTSTEDLSSNVQPDQSQAVSNENGPTTVGNSLIGRLGWSTSFEDCDSSLTSSVISRSSEGVDAPRTPGEGPTYDALIQSYHTAGYATTPDLRDFLNKYPTKKKVDIIPVPEEPQAEPTVKATESLDELLGKIPHEKGLDVQNYSCLDCGHPIGMNFSKAHVCAFSGDYYCTNCMSAEEFLIPSRMIHNWDLKRYIVCQKAARYLTDCTTLLDLKTLNPRIYMAVDNMAQLQSLRIQLNLLRAYLFTCREPIIESLQKKVSPKDYLYEHVHQYAVSDLADIPNGALAMQLQKVIEFARNHVMNCWLCSQKGFICEVCDNPKVIYPFDMESTYRCGVCNAVFHMNCLNASKPCPKCERRRKRMDRPLLDMGNTDIPTEGTSAVIP